MNDLKTVSLDGVEYPVETMTDQQAEVPKIIKLADGLWVRQEIDKLRAEIIAGKIQVPDYYKMGKKK